MKFDFFFSIILKNYLVEEENSKTLQINLVKISKNKKYESNSTMSIIFDSLIEYNNEDNNSEFKKEKEIKRVSLKNSFSRDIIFSQLEYSENIREYNFKFYSSNTENNVVLDCHYYDSLVFLQSKSFDPLCFKCNFFVVDYRLTNKSSSLALSLFVKITNETGLNIQSFSEENINGIFLFLFLFC